MNSRPATASFELAVRTGCRRVGDLTFLWQTVGIKDASLDGYCEDAAGGTANYTREGQQQSGKKLAKIELMPSEGRHVKLRNLTLYYEEYGSGEPLVLLHGGTVNARKMWEKVLPTFSKYFRTIAPDSRGHGKSDNPTGKFSYRLMADDMVELIRALGLEKPLICGYSDGGQTCLEIGMHYPDVAGKLVVGAACSRLTPTFIKSTKELGIDRPGVVNIEQIEKMRPQFVSRLRELSTVYGPEYWKRYLKQMSEMWLKPLNYTTEDYKKIKSPTLILVGDRDDDVSLEDAIEMYRSIPKAELAVLPGSDHYLVWSKTELFTKTVLDFLQGQNRH